MNKKDIYFELRRRICLLDYQPGARLNERELASEFNISRTPMRSILQKLEHNGLIASQHGNGTIVTWIDLKSMRDIYIVRMRLMDAMGDSTPAPRCQTVLEKMRELEARCDAMLVKQDKREFAQVLLHLHTILHGLANNAVLKEINDTLFFQSARFWFLLLDRVNFRVQVKDLRQEIRTLQQSLKIGDANHINDVKLTATIHKTYLGVVVSRLDAIEAEGGVLFEAK
jgi:DNA-binding GntR family transcriptional regulator